MYLAHVIADPRTPATAVGSSTAATQWSPVRDEQRFAAVRPVLTACRLQAVEGSLLSRAIEAVVVDEGWW